MNNLYIAHDIYENLILENDVKQSIELLPNENFGTEHQLMGNHTFKRDPNDDFKHVMDSNSIGTVMNLPKVKSLRSSSRCIVIIVPNRDLTSQILRDLEDLDPMGRLSIQTLVNVDPTHSPRSTITESRIFETKDDNNIINSSISYLDDLVTDNPQPQPKNMFYEDQMALMQNIPTTAVQDVNVEIISHKYGLRRTQMSAISKHKYGVPGIKVDKVEYIRQPQIISPRIQWGSADIVITTPQLFLNDIMHFRDMNMYPSIVVFDEVDMLMENNAHRSNLMQIVSYLRPRPKIYNPLLSGSKPKGYIQKQVPPCQFINVAATINTSGPITCGNMLNERFSTSVQVNTPNVHTINPSLKFENHELSDENPHFTAFGIIEKYFKNTPFRAVIFCESIATAKTTSKYFQTRGWPTLEFHSNLSLTTRLANLDTFSTFTGSIIIIATDLLSRGIDLVSCNVIINLDFPKDCITYLHRLGKTCRLNHQLVDEPTVVNFTKPSDQQLLHKIEELWRQKKTLNTIFSRKRSLHNRAKAEDSKNTPTNEVISTSFKSNADKKVSNAIRDSQINTLPPLLAQQRNKLLNESPIDITNARDEMDIPIEKLSIRNRRRLLYSNYCNYN